MTVLFKNFKKNIFFLPTSLLCMRFFLIKLLGLSRHTVVIKSLRPLTTIKNVYIFITLLPVFATRAKIYFAVEL